LSVEFPPIKIEPTYRRVASSIAARIIDRTLQDGDPLPTETALAAQLGVNRSTVREAFRELESRGLVERRKGTRRLVVTRPATGTLAERVSHALALHDVTVDEVWETLMMLEPPAAEAAARRATPAQLQAIRDAAAAFAERNEDTAEAVATVTRFFHAVIAATGNRALALAHEPPLRLLASSLQFMIDRVPQARTRIATAQRKLVQAFEQRDADGAREWMEKHIRDFRRGFVVAGIDPEHRAAPLPED
jgi:GntR family transcriptional repressor for pyruvate dehydrogenase complex